ncbi:MAG: Hpt domain-containing protein [Fibrobacterota bacterium]
MPDTAIFNPKRIIELTGSDSELISELTTMYVEDNSRRIERIKTQLASGKITEASREAHSLKGASLNLGAPAMAKAAKKLEDCLLEAGKNDSDLILVEISDIFNKIKNEIKNFQENLL